MPKSIRIAFVLLMALAVIEALYEPARSMLPLGGSQIIQIAVVLVAVLMLIELWDIFFGGKNDNT